MLGINVPQRAMFLTCKMQIVFAGHDITLDQSYTPGPVPAHSPSTHVMPPHVFKSLFCVWGGKAAPCTLAWPS
jgi:hypothetical protein